MLRHIRSVPKEKVEAAAEYAVAIGAPSYKTIAGLADAKPRRPPAKEDTPLLFRENLHKPNYFQ